MESARLRNGPPPARCDRANTSAMLAPVVTTFTVTESRDTNETEWLPVAAQARYGSCRILIDYFTFSCHPPASWGVMGYENKKKLGVRN
ncbi:hypothetical protein EVAR_49341_1 [Eumeta japonica]|uniref:Uncharacterized protein n=1 Tax=Eumeta variegata TaxID=151549 RepID=A0A4C1XYU6_EUMVA|nr:hypothetical protein EVAR_49341_1 [Eumeta japonica]